MNLTDLTTAFAAHNWLLLVMMVAVYARTLAGSQSKFPINLPPNWLPVFSGLAGAVVTSDSALMQGKSTGASVLLGVVGFVGGGFLDGMVSAVFGDATKAPTWAKAIVFLVDDVVGGSGGSGPNITTIAVPTNESASSKANTNSAAMTRGFVLSARMLVLSIVAVACANGVPTPATQAVINASAQLAMCVETVIQRDESTTPPAPMTQVVLDEGLQCGPAAAALVNALGQETSAANQSGVIATVHASIVAHKAALAAGH